MGGGLESGVIHNQSNEEVRYILHHKELVSTSGIVKRGVNVQANAGFKFGGGGNEEPGNDAKQDAADQADTKEEGKSINVGGVNLSGDTNGIKAEYGAMKGQFAFGGKDKSDAKQDKQANPEKAEVKEDGDDAKQNKGQGEAKPDAKEDNKQGGDAKSNEKKQIKQGVGAGVGAKYESTENKKAELTNCTYYVKPGSITTVGLVNVDFDKIKFITIVFVESGNNIIQSGKVGSYKDLCIKIREDHSSKGMSEQEAQALIKIGKGDKTGKSQKCWVCNKQINTNTEKDDKNKEATNNINKICDLIQVFQQMECQGCKKNNKQFWVCRLIPTNHYFCQHCWRQKNISKKNNKQSSRFCCGL